MNLDYISKVIVMILIYNNNERVPISHILLYLYQLKFVFKQLDIEIVNTTNLKDHNKQIMQKIFDLFNDKIIVQKNNKLELTKYGIDLYSTIKDDFSKDDINTIEYFKETLNNLTYREFLALVYFSHPIIIDDDIQNDIISNKLKLAISMYFKDSITMPKAASISGKCLQDFFDILLDIKDKGLINQHIINV